MEKQLRSDARTLTEDEQELALELRLKGYSLVDIARKLAFNSDMAFLKYRKRNPSFDKCLDDARVANCDHLEDELLGIHKAGLDAQMARVQLEAYKAVLAFRNPARYNPKIDLQVTQTLDLSAVLLAAATRLPALERPVEEISSDSDELL